MLVIVDDFTRFTAVYPIPNKSSQTVTDKFKEFIAQYCCNMKMPNSIMTDWGSEFDGAFAVYCRENRIQMRKSCPYRAYQNGLVERANRSLSRIARAMMLDAEMGPEFWALALMHSAWMLNRVCHMNDMNRPNRMTPFELFYDAGKPDLTKLRVFGCAAVIHVEDIYIPKDFSIPHGVPAIYVGMCDKSPSGRFFIPSTRKVVSRKDAVYYEYVPGCRRERVGSTEMISTSHDDMPCPSVDAPGAKPKAKTDSVITVSDALPGDDLYDPSPLDSVLEPSTSSEKPSEPASTPTTDATAPLEVIDAIDVDIKPLVTSM